MDTVAAPSPADIVKDLTPEAKAALILEGRALLVKYYAQLVRTGKKELQKHILDWGFHLFPEKFFLPCRILEAKSYNASIKQGQFRPFESSEIIICSYQFAKSRAADVHAMPWD